MDTIFEAMLPRIALKVDFLIGDRIAVTLQFIVPGKTLIEGGSSDIRLPAAVHV